MPKGKNQKFKLYRLAQIMSEQTDEDHYITMPEIMSALEEYEITADRKGIYEDLKDLEKLGIEIEGERIGSGYHYHVIGRDSFMKDCFFFVLESTYRQIFFNFCHMISNRRKKYGYFKENTSGRTGFS